jgi:hypothetical protein
MIITGKISVFFMATDIKKSKINHFPCDRHTAASLKKLNITLILVLTLHHWFLLRRTVSKMYEVLGSSLGCNNYVLITSTVRKFPESKFKMNEVIGSK